MTLRVLIPLRSPGVGKTRLSPEVSTEDRARLTAAMLADVVAAVRGAGLDVPTILASGPAAAAAAGALGCPVRLDPPQAGLNAAIEDAAQRLGDRDDVLVLLADLPLLTSDDVATILEVDTPIGLAPTSDGGTSALLRRPGRIMTTAFGADSATRHERLADALGLDVTVLTSPGLAADLDTMDDLEKLDPASVGPALARVLIDRRGIRSQ